MSIIGSIVASEGKLPAKALRDGGKQSEIVSAFTDTHYS